MASKFTGTFLITNKKDIIQENWWNDPNAILRTIYDLEGEEWPACSPHGSHLLKVDYTDGNTKYFLGGVPLDTIQWID